MLHEPYLRIILLIPIFIIASCKLAIANNVEPIYEFRFIEQDVSHSDKIVYRSIQDTFGIQWLATKTGLYWFDGFECHLINIDKNTPFNPSLKVRSLAILEGYKLVASYDSGLIIVDIRTHMVLPQSSLNLPESFQQATRILVCSKAKNKLLFLADQDLYEYKADSCNYLHTFQFPLNTEKVGTLFYDPVSEQTLIFLKNPARVLCLSNDKKECIIDQYQLHEKVDSSTDSKPLHLPFPIIFRSSELYLQSNFSRKTAPSELLYFSSTCELKTIVKKDDRLSSIKNIILQWKEYLKEKYPPDRIPFFYINDIHIDAHETFWISTNIGLFPCTEATNLAREYVTASSNSIRSFTETKDNNMLVGGYFPLMEISTKKDSIIRTYELTNVQDIKWNSSISSFFMGLEESQGFFKADYRNNDQLAFQKLIPDSLKNHSFISSITSSDEFIWAIANNGNLYEYSLQHREIRTFDLTDVFSRSTFTNKKIILYSQSNGLWIGDKDGLQNIKISQNGVHKISYHASREKLPEILAKVSITDLVESLHNILWIATQENGVYRYDLQSGLLQNYNTENGLASNSICCLQLDQERKELWASTQKGVAFFDLQEDTKILQAHKLTSSIKEFNRDACYQATDGTLFFGGINGFISCEPHDFKMQTERISPIMLLNGQLDGKKAVITYDTTSVLNLQAGSYSFDLTIATNSLFHQMKHQYFSMQQQSAAGVSYQPTKAGFPLSTRIGPGTHLFEFQVIPFNGKSAKQISLTIHVDNYWYNKIWFRLLVLFATILVTSLFFYRRNIALRKEIKLKENIANNLHDEIGSRLVLLNILSGQLVSSNKTNSTNPLISSLRSGIAETLKRTRDLIWVIDNDGLTTADLADRLEHYGIHYVSHLVETYSFSQKELKSVPISSQLSLDVSLIYQELLTNILKHTLANSIDIILDQPSKNILRIQLISCHEGLKTSDYSDQVKKGTYSLANRTRSPQINLEQSYLSKKQEHIITVKLER